ncbi:MAG: alcohol dehydrogenase catalytic domain-containing protein [Chitinivibrionales bacterium]|nr:alcohol dehydrogenase catalytic domain-containing protein [Chitinivibrionales bacterium]
MKALVLKQYNEFDYTDVPEPRIGDNDVLVRVKACGICGSDVHGMDGSTGRRQPPVIMGHEAAGIIAKTGAAVQGFREGDRVTFDSTVYCGECRFCRRGEINLCDNRRVLGVSCDDYRCDGAFAEYVAVPARILYPLPDGLSFDRAAMVEALSIAFHAVRITPVVLDDTAVVAGAGMIGLLVIQALRAAGCGTIVAVDVDDGKLELARTLGADIGVRADKTDVAAEVTAATQGRGADLAFEVVGIAPTVSAAIASVRKGGCVTLVGNLTPEVQMPLQQIVTRQVRLQGSCASAGEYPACLDMMNRGTIDVDTLISATAPLAEGAEWFRRLYQKEAGLMKVILNP